MAANSSIVLSNIDFDTHKETLKSYLKSQDKFKDYDFEGSNINVLLDLLSYNTFHNVFYLNMVGNEAFLDSAILRDSVVSHAKDLNYVPRSFKSAEAIVTLQVTSNDQTKTSVLIPKGTTFTAPFFNRSFTFSTSENILLQDYTISGDFRVFTSKEIALYEGIYVTDSFVYSESSIQRYQLSNKNVDTSSINVTVLEDSGAQNHTYSRALSLFNLDAQSKVFFIQAGLDESYEILFGDNVSGRAPKNNSVVLVEYRVSNGELPNGALTFNPDTALDGVTNISVTTIEGARGGAVSESIESIRYNAPRHFAAQERAITTEDYEALLKINFPEINAVSAFGGEDLNPPQFGKVFIAVDLNDVDGLPQTKKQEYTQFLKPRTPVAIQPMFITPEYVYLEVQSEVNYNVNTTRLAPEDIKTIVSSSILNYARTNLNNFNRVFRYSNLVRIIDGSQSSIVSNETQIRAIKELRNVTLGQFLTFDVKFDLPLKVIYNQRNTIFCVESSEFIYKEAKATIRDNGTGVLFAVSTSTDTPIEQIGTIDYERGLLQFSNFKIDNIPGNSIKIYVTPAENDLSTVNNVILSIREEDLLITVTGT